MYGEQQSELLSFSKSKHIKINTDKNSFQNIVLNKQVRLPENLRTIKHAIGQNSSEHRIFIELVITTGAATFGNARIC